MRRRWHGASEGVGKPWEVEIVSDKFERRVNATLAGFILVCGVAVIVRLLVGFSQ